MKSIYFDNAATGFPKSEKVIASVAAAMKECGNAGRSGHVFSENASKTLYSCREKLAKLFGSVPENVVLCPNATAALNMAVKGIGANRRGAALTSDMEHNSVMRPLYALEKYGIRVDTFPTALHNDKETVDNFVFSLKSDTAFCVITHASNVCGKILPVEEMASEAKKKNVPVIVDASQTAGTVPLSLAGTDIDVLCFPGHKGLFGPLGTGALIVNPKSSVTFETVMEGGAGISSEDPYMPELLPERLEPGTLNAPAFAGLSAACGELSFTFDEMKAMIKELTEGLSAVPGVELHGAPDGDYETYVPTVLITKKGMTTDELFSALDRNGICVRSGLHCAPAAHKKLGTLETGGVRISPGKKNRRSDFKRLFETLGTV